MKSRGHHRRRMWTARALRRLMYDGTSNEDGPRPYFAIIVPGAIGMMARPIGLPDEMDFGWHNPMKQALIDAIGFTVPPTPESDWIGDTPKGLKYFYVGVWRSRWCISGCLYSRSPSHNYPGELPGLAAFINQIQKVTAQLVTVYSCPNPLDHWSGKRYQKLFPIHRYAAIYGVKEPSI